MELQSSEIKSICRTCLSVKDEMKDIFLIADILMSCVPIQIEQGDGLPTSICSECANKLNQTQEFRLLCEQSDNYLRSKIISITSQDNSASSSNDEATIETDLDDEILINRQNKLPKRKTRHKKNFKKQNDCSNNDNFEFDESEIKNEVTTDDQSDDEFDKNGKTMQCRFCDMKFRYKVRLKNHEEKHMEGLKCHLCEKDFSTLKQLTNHLNIHSRRGAHLCQICGKQFTLPENLIRHQRIHNGIRPYKCPLCNKSFTQSNELKSHIVTHTAEKNHLCSICGNKYSRSISLKVHMRRMHSIPPNHRPYICSVCGRNFKDRRDLSQHMQIHTGERSHICKICNKAFNRSSNLRVHERIHSGHKPHACPICHRAFIQKHVLITHMRTHPHNSPPVEIKMHVDDQKDSLKIE